MAQMLIIGLVIVGMIICCVVPYVYEQHYVEMYGGKGLAYLFSVGLGLSGFYFTFVVEEPGTTKYIVTVLAMAVFALLLIGYIVKELHNPAVETKDKILFCICQIMLPIGVFVLLVILACAIYFVGGGGKRKKR